MRQLLFVLMNTYLNVKFNYFLKEANGELEFLAQLGHYVNKVSFIDGCWPSLLSSTLSKFLLPQMRLSKSKPNFTWNLREKEEQKFI